jgi:hypothetical protein
MAPFPVIREFAAMLWMLKPGEQWMGREFFGYAGEARRLNLKQPALVAEWSVSSVKMRLRCVLAIDG